MKLDQKTGSLIKSDMLVEKHLTIKADAKAFEAIYGKLYSNHIKAIIRELSCNAYDSHVEAGKKDVPFDVKLPNALDLEFYIRDYGTGISPENMDNVYTVCFESTKTETNEQVGCLGLGSKTPFSYTDNFVVESYYNGKKYTYTMYLNQKRNPAYTLMATSNTTEPNGLLVKFSTKRDDYHKWLAEAKAVYPYFDLVPNIIGNTNFKNELGQMKTLFEFDNFKVIDTAGTYGIPHGIIMGNIKYDLNSNYNYSFGTSNCAVLARVNIGDVDFTTSREALEYSEKTNRKIDALIKDFKSKISKELEKEIVRCKDFWEAFKTYNTLRSKYPISGLSFNGKSLDDIQITLGSGNYVVKRLTYSHKMKKTYTYSLSDFIGKEIFVASEKSPKYVSKFREYIDNNNVNQSYLIKSLNATGDLFSELKQFDIYPNHVHILDNMPAPTKVATNTSTITRNKNCVHGYIVDENGKQSLSNVPLSQLEYYIQCDFTSYAAMSLNGKSLNGYGAEDLISMIRILNKLLKKNIRVICVTASNLEKVEKSGWIKFEDYFNTLKQQFIKELFNVKRARLADNIKNSNLHLLKPKIKYNCWLKKLLDNVDSWKTNLLGTEINKIASYWSQKQVNDYNITNIVHQQYPLLKHISFYKDYMKQDYVSDYINMIEEKKHAARNLKSLKQRPLPTKVVI